MNLAENIPFQFLEKVVYAAAATTATAKPNSTAAAAAAITISAAGKSNESKHARTNDIAR